MLYTYTYIYTYINTSDFYMRPLQYVYGETALHGAARRGHSQVVKVLVDQGADMETRDTTVS